MHCVKLSTKSSTVTCVILAAMAQGMATQGALAQQQSSTQIESGLFYSVDARARYTSNILRLSDQEKIDNPELSASDGLLETTARVAFGKQLGRQSIGLSLDAGYNLHDKNTQLDNELINAVAAVNWQLGALCKGQASGLWYQRQSQIESLDDIESNDLRDKSVNLSAVCRVGGNISITGQSSFTAVDNSLERAEINDRSDALYAAGIRYMLSEDRYIGIFAQQVDSKYSNRTTLQGDRSRLDRKSIAAEISYTFGPNLVVVGNLGYIEAEDNEADVNRYSGLSSELSFEYSLANRHFVTLDLLNVTRPQESIQSVFSQEKGAALGIRSNWSNRLTSQLSYEITDRENTFAPNPVLGTEGLNFADKTNLFQASLQYKMGRLITLELGGRYEDRSADLERFDYDTREVFFAIRVGN